MPIQPSIIGDSQPIFIAPHSHWCTSCQVRLRSKEHAQVIQSSPTYHSIFTTQNLHHPVIPGPAPHCVTQHLLTPRCQPSIRSKIRHIRLPFSFFLPESFIRRLFLYKPDLELGLRPDFLRVSYFLVSTSILGRELHHRDQIS